MQAREKKLAIGLGAVIVAVKVLAFISAWYFAPIEQEAAALMGVQTELDTLQNQQMQLLNATRKMAEWKSKSLPPDPKPLGRQTAHALNGQRLYQEWLTDLARHCGFREPEVVSNPTKSFQDVYVTVPVRVKAEATYGQLCQFLSLFEQADILHRIDVCQIESSNHRGDPLFDVLLVAEAVALQSAPQRDLLFPRTELHSPIEAADVKLTVNDARGFPKSGRFGIRIGEELMTVSQVKGNDWQINRGKDKTKPVAHASGGIVDLGLYDPLTSSGPERATHPRLAMISEQNPFTIPPPKLEGRPYLNLPREQIVYLGNRLSLDAKAEGLNPALGPPKFELTGDIPPGLRIETSRDRPFSGFITWEPKEESQIATYSVSIKVTRDDLPSPLTGSVRIRVEEKNFPPTFATVPGRQLVYSGQTLRFSVKATDDARQRLTYSLASGTPPEATIDPVTGQLSWTPPGVVTEQVLDLEILATDNGRPAEQASVKVPVEVRADVAFFTKFVGSLTEADASEAWLFDRWNKRNLVIREGEMLEVADITARLMKVRQGVLLFQRNGENFELELGHDVREMKPVPTASTAKVN